MTGDHIQIKIKMPNPSQEPSASSKAPNQDLKDMDVLFTFKIKMDSQNFEQGCTKDQWPYLNQDQDANPSQEPPASSKAQIQDLKDMNVLCIFKFKIDLEHRCIKYQWPYQNQDQDANPNQEPQLSSKA